MKNLDLLETFDAVQRFNQCRIPMRHSYKVAKALRVLTPEWTMIHELRNKLLDQYGKKDDDGKLIQRQEAGATITELNDPEAFNADWGEVLDQPVDVAITGIAIAELGDDLPITGEDIELLVRVGLLLEATPNGKKPRRKRSKK